MLYHCLYKEPEGEALLPTCEREVNGRTDTFLYAATHMSKALAFSFSYHEGEVCLNSGIPDTDEEFVIVCGGQPTLDKPRHVRVYGFADDGFEEIQGYRQAVSRNAVNFSDTQLVLETTDIKDLMENGLQIFLMQETADEWEKEEMFETYVQKQGGILYNLVREGRAHWINMEQSVNPNQKLLCNFRREDRRRAAAVRAGHALSV